MGVTYGCEKLLIRRIERALTMLRVIRISFYPNRLESKSGHLHTYQTNTYFTHPLHIFNYIIIHLLNNNID